MRFALTLPTPFLPSLLTSELGPEATSINRRLCILFALRNPMWLLIVSSRCQTETQSVDISRPCVSRVLRRQCRSELFIRAPIVRRGISSAEVSQHGSGSSTASSLICCPRCRLTKTLERSTSCATLVPSSSLLPQCIRYTPFSSFAHDPLLSSPHSHV